MKKIIGLLFSSLIVCFALAVPSAKNISGNDKIDFAAFQNSVFLTDQKFYKAKTLELQSPDGQMGMVCESEKLHEKIK